MGYSFVLPALLLLCSYLCGSLPLGFFIAKGFRGRTFDIRDYGSGNIGFTNVVRVVGWDAGLLVLVADVLKGALPALVGASVVGSEFGALCLGFACIGHARSFYFYCIEGDFSGGKSVATLLGGILVLQPALAGVGFGVWVLVLLITRYMSLASILGCLAGCLGACFLGLGWFWYFYFGLALLGVLVTHARNLSRLAVGTEPRFGKRPHDSDYDVTVAFLVHMLDENDLAQTCLTRWLYKLYTWRILSQSRLHRLLMKSPVMESGQITGITTLTGKGVRVLVFCVPLFPAQIKEPLNLELIMSFLRRTAILAQRRGARVLGLGALLSTVGNGGADLQSWCTGRGLTIQIDNGAAFTVGATIEALRQTCRKDLADCVVTNIGARGFIGNAICSYLKGKVKQLIRVARDWGKVKDEGAAIVYRLSSSPEYLEESDVLIFNTSAQEPVLKASDSCLLREGALILDVAVPPDVYEGLAKDRPDVTLVRSGLATLPGCSQTAVDLHFGSVEQAGRELQLYPACLCQTILLGLTGEFRYASRGRKVEAEDVDFFLQAAAQHGIKIRVSYISEPALFSRIPLAV